MKKGYLALAGRIREEIVELQQVVDRVQVSWERAKQTNDDFYLDAVALNLHSFYTGLERFSPAKMAPLVGNLPQIFSRVKGEIEAFASFVEMRGTDEVTEL